MDWKWTITAVLPVITLVLGAWLNQRSDEHREEAALRREERLRQLEREHARLDRRESFELTHLEEVYAALRKANTAALKFRVVRTSGGDVDAPGRELNEANRELSSLTRLVLDDDIREKVQQAQIDAGAMAIDPATHADAPSTGVQAQHSLGEAQEAIAKRLREIYGPRPLRP
ncbi:hypothetical protein [Streptomyces cylindrosporus]|uniref:Uncharacterized protein n=1 Tax=Streptomyces cylindrosporus TaxID=2927583 RepID=A0ABS9Y2H2_9ACTN|nr:hypothetical protein [Streptomyces cylindrosporus]MCI3271407.1 hypothetical protein [Streptomyces cylindrosporus]